MQNPAAKSPSLATQITPAMRPITIHATNAKRHPFSYHSFWGVVGLLTDGFEGFVDDLWLGCGVVFIGIDGRGVET